VIKIISDLHPPRLFEISPADTTQTLQDKLISAAGESFEISLIETSNSRTLPRDEILIDGREYFIDYLRLPIKGGL